MPDQTEALLRALLATSGRAAFSVEQIHGILSSKGRSVKHIKAYNLADGTRTQGEIARRVKLDSGNFSRTVSLWVAAGVMFRLADGILLHLYPVPEKLPRG